LLIDFDDETEPFISAIQQLIGYAGEACPQICAYGLKQGAAYLKGLFSQVDYIILNKDYNSVVYSDYALDYHVHILYSYDENIFTELKSITSTRQTSLIKEKKILFLGNSLTLHGHASYWWGSWGMAASEKIKIIFMFFKSCLRKRA
jgi:hypothetical protein